jgi:hypothetical protein
MKTTKLNKVIHGALLPILASAGFGLCGCASIVDGRTPKISINSSPEGAKVIVVDKGDKEVVSGTTPFVATLKRSRGYFQGAQYKLIFELVGHKRTEATITSKVNGWYVGNIFFGGLIGMLFVDPATGAMWSLHPKMIEQPLDKEQSTQLREGNCVVVALKNQATPNEQRHMQPVNPEQ